MFILSLVTTTYRSRLVDNRTVVKSRLIGLEKVVSSEHILHFIVNVSIRFNFSGQPATQDMHPTHQMGRKEVTLNTDEPAT